MRRSTAEPIRDGKGWYWPPNSQKAHYYLADNRTACGRGFVFILPDDLAGFVTPPSPDDCAGCARKVADAHAALDPTSGDSEPGGSQS